MWGIHVPSPNVNVSTSIKKVRTCHKINEANIAPERTQKLIRNCNVEKYNEMILESLYLYDIEICTMEKWK